MNFQSHKSALLEIKKLTIILSEDVYSRPLDTLSGSSIGQHMRHIVEFYTCLLSQLQGQVINYDLRKRNQLIEKLPKSCALAIDEILVQLDEFASKFESKPLRFENCNFDTDMGINPITTSFSRELVYCLDHCIHHQYFIKIGLVSLELGHCLHEEFGVAPSTLMHRKS
ncbi:MAG: DinB family protein [Flavobacteriaceae bacterium]|nr:DinB family protein [Flavobacteriaceae bacterium]